MGKEQVLWEYRLGVEGGTLFWQNGMADLYYGQQLLLLPLYQGLYYMIELILNTVTVK